MVRQNRNLLASRNSGCSEILLPLLTVVWLEWSGSLLRVALLIVRLDPESRQQAASCSSHTGGGESRQYNGTKSRQQSMPKLQDGTSATRVVLSVEEHRKDKGATWRGILVQRQLGHLGSPCCVNNAVYRAASLSGSPAGASTSTRGMGFPFCRCTCPVPRV